MKNYYLFLDDERFPKNVTWIDLPAQNWQIVRSYDEFVKFIENNGIPVFVSFDHDLSADDQGKVPGSHPFKEMTGFHCAKWLVEYCLDNGHKIPNYLAHTMNPIGRENIISIMEQGKRIQGSLK